MSLVSVYNFTTYRKFTVTSCIEELQARKPLSSSLASNIQEATSDGFEPLRHKFPYYYKNSTRIDDVICSQH